MRYFIPSCVAALALAAAGPASAQAPARIPVEAFFDNPAMSGARLSPDGRHVAIAMTRKGARTQLTVLDTEQLTAKVIAAPSDADINRIEWVNDDRIVFNVWDGTTATGANYLRPGLYAVQRDGTGFMQLVDRVQPYARERNDAKGLDWNHYLLGPTQNRSTDDVFVERASYTPAGEFDAITLLRLDTRTGRATPYQRPGKSIQWVVDRRDVPRATRTYEGGRTALHLLQADGTWRKLAEYDPHERDTVAPFGFGPDGSFYVVARKGGDREALYRWDAEKNAPDAEPILALPEHDFAGQLVADGKQVRGIHYLTDARATAWLDPALKAAQAKVDALLPGTVNLLEPPLRGDAPFVLVRAYSDRDPGRYLLFHTGTGKLTELGAVMRDIDAKRMAQRDLVRIQVRDGLTIPAWLTLPPGGKGRKHPLVVLAHGGPWLRGGEWNWDAESQFLASRGYAVLQPEFRGGTGWGYDLYRKGFRQWGLSMQNDLADAARWAVRQGVAEPERICIGGGSYGGYATLMGLANDADVFRCGFAWAAVTDLDLMYSATWSDLSDQYKVHSMPVLVGDREKDAEQLKATSPLQQAARIRQPLLLAHGGADRRVPIAHGVRFRDAVVKANANVEWIEYVDEGHGWKLVPTRVDFWTRVEKFLERQIGAR